MENYERLTFLSSTKETYTNCATSRCADVSIASHALH